MRFYANCFIVAYAMKVLHPLSVKVKRTRDPFRGPHYFWRDKRDPNNIAMHFTYVKDRPKEKAYILTRPFPIFLGQIEPMSGAWKEE